jgi:hypothetical protein
LAVVKPTMTPPINPGPAVAAMASTPASPIPASDSAAAITPSSFSTWARAAISGTTPAKGACSSIWEKTTLDRIVPSSRTTAAAVSSQLVSMPSIVVT